MDENCSKNLVITITNVFNSRSNKNHDLPFTDEQRDGCEETDDSNECGEMTRRGGLVHNANVFAGGVAVSPALRRDASEDDNRENLCEKAIDFIFARIFGTFLQPFKFIIIKFRHKKRRTNVMFVRHKEMCSH